MLDIKFVRENPEALDAAMIAVVAREKYLRGEFAELTVDADPNMTL